MKICDNESARILSEKLRGFDKMEELSLLFNSIEQDEALYIPMILSDLIPQDDDQVFHDQNAILTASCINTPLGPMVTIANHVALLLLAFINCRGLAQAVKRLHKKAIIVPGTTPPIVSIEQELTAYFKGTLKTFTTPLAPSGSPFQQRVWEALGRIPYGETRSYLEQATLIEHPTACRAVANANGANPLIIVIPCHRIINNNGKLGGYGGGIARKQWLIQHEQQCFKMQ